MQRKKKLGLKNGSKNSRTQTNCKFFLFLIRLTFQLRILVPVLSGGHWFLVVIDIKNYRLTRLDSLTGNRTKEMGFVKTWAEKLCKYRNDNPKEFEIKTQQNFPKQLDGVSCGVFMIKAINLIINGVQYDNVHELFTAQDMSRIRQKLKKALLAGERPSHL